MSTIPIPFRYALGQPVRWAKHPRTVWLVERRRYEERRHGGPVVEYGLVPAQGEAVLVEWSNEADLLLEVPV